MTRTRTDDGCTVLIGRFMPVQDPLPLPGGPEQLLPHDAADTKQPKPTATLESSNSQQTQKQ